MAPPTSLQSPLQPWSMGKNHPFPGKITHFLGRFLRSSCLHLGYDGQAPPSGLQDRRMGHFPAADGVGRCLAMGIWQGSWHWQCWKCCCCVSALVSVNHGNSDHGYWPALSPISTPSPVTRRPSPPCTSTMYHHHVPVATRKAEKETLALRIYVLKGFVNQTLLLYTQFQNQWNHTNYPFQTQLR